MEDDKKSYPDQNIEHKFGYKEQRKSNENDLKVIKIQDARRQKENQENGGTKKKGKYKEKKATLIVVFLGILITLLSALSFELYLIPKGLYPSTLIVNIVLEVIFLVIGVLLNQKEILESGKFDESGAERMISAGKALIKLWKHLGVCRLLFWAGLCIFFGQIIGKNGWIKDAGRAWQAAVYVFLNEEVEVLSASETRRPENTNVLSSKDEETLKQIKDLTISQDEKNREMNLSPKDRAAVCFEGGEYNISVLESEDEINKVIEDFVTKQRNKKRKNIFDKPEEEGGAPEVIKGKISMASEKENEVKSFGEAEEILVGREDIYLKYPKASLVKLISNGYERLALVLLYHGGNLDTINYYYCQSILKDFEYLEYDELSDANIKSRLLKIVQKYEDMRLINSENNTEFSMVKKLRDAFQYVADQY